MCATCSWCRRRSCSCAPISSATIGGFDPAISFHGDDVELCWRIHHSGARVVVAPSARVRHRAHLAERRPDLNHRMLEARHRMRSVATLTGSTRLPGRSVEMVLLTVVELVVGVVHREVRGSMGVAARAGRLDPPFCVDTPPPQGGQTTAPRARNAKCSGCRSGEAPGWSGSFVPRRSPRSWASTVASGGGGRAPPLRC